MKPRHNKYQKRMQQKNYDLPATLGTTLPPEIRNILVQDRTSYTRAYGH